MVGLLTNLSTMKQRPHDNPGIAAKGQMQYMWRRPNVREQEVVRKEKIQLEAQMAVEDGNDFDSLVGQVMDQGDYNFHTFNMPNKRPKSNKKDNL